MPPGATATESEVKNSMRGALGLRLTASPVGAATIAVEAAPKSGVGDGPPVAVMSGRVGTTVGVTLRAGVRVGASVEVAVAVGRAVGITCTAVAPQPATISSIAAKMS